MISPMVIDISQYIAATERSIDSRVVNGEHMRVLVAKRTFATDQADLWDALTSIERIPNWFLPISGDLKVGGRFQFEGNAGGEILECDPDSHFKVTWEGGGAISWVDIFLTPNETGTQLKLEHLAMVPKEMWDQFGPGAVGIGWEMGLIGMQLHVVEKQPRVPGAGMAWAGSDNGKDFIRASSQKWCEASIAFGTPEEEARAAATRCTGAYTGEA